jgi:hypothetical protein
VAFEGEQPEDVVFLRIEEVETDSKSLHFVFTWTYFGDQNLPKFFIASGASIPRTEFNKTIIKPGQRIKKDLDKTGLTEKVLDRLEDTTIELSRSLRKLTPRSTDWKKALAELRPGTQLMVMTEDNGPLWELTEERWTGRGDFWCTKWSLGRIIPHLVSPVTARNYVESPALLIIAPNLSWTKPLRLLDSRESISTMETEDAPQSRAELDLDDQILRVMEHFVRSYGTDSSPYPPMVYLLVGDYEKDLEKDANIQIEQATSQSVRRALSAEEFDAMYIFADADNSNQSIKLANDELLEATELEAAIAENAQHGASVPGIILLYGCNESWLSHTLLRLGAAAVIECPWGVADFQSHQFAAHLFSELEGQRYRSIGELVRNARNNVLLESRTTSSLVSAYVLRGGPDLWAPGQGSQPMKLHFWQNFEVLFDPWIEREEGFTPRGLELVTETRALREAKDVLKELTLDKDCVFLSGSPIRGAIEGYHEEIRIVGELFDPDIGYYALVVPDSSPLARKNQAGLGLLAGKRIGVDDLSAPHALTTMSILESRGLTVHPLQEAGVTPPPKAVQMIEFIHVEDMMSCLDSGAIDAAIVWGFDAVRYEIHGGYTKIADPMKIFEEEHPDKRIVGPVLVTSQSALSTPEGEHLIVEMLRMVRNGIQRVRETRAERVTKYSEKYDVPDTSISRMIDQAQDDKIFITNVREFKDSIRETHTLVRKFLGDIWDESSIEKLVYPISDRAPRGEDLFRFSEQIHDSDLASELSENHGIDLRAARNFTKILRTLTQYREEDERFEGVFMLGEIESVTSLVDEREIDRSIHPANIAEPMAFHKLKLCPSNLIVGFDSDGSLKGSYSVSEKLIERSKKVIEPCALDDRPYVILSEDPEVIVAHVDSGVGSVTVFSRGSLHYVWRMGYWYRFDAVAFRQFLRGLCNRLGLEDRILMKTLQIAHQMKLLAGGGTLVLTSDPKKVYDSCDGTRAVIGGSILEEDFLQEMPKRATEDLATIIGFDGTVHWNRCNLKSSPDAASKVLEISEWATKMGSKHQSAAAFSYDHPNTLCIVISANGPITIFDRAVSKFSEWPWSSHNLMME